MSYKYKDLSQDIKEYRINWERENVRRIIVKMNVKTEKELVDWIESKPNKQSYIKSLIEADMKKCQNSNKESDNNGA